MPSLKHEILVDLFRQDPALLLHLLRSCLGVELPAYTRIRIGEGDLTQLAPAEFRADLVLVFYVEEQPVYAVILEIQLNRDTRKRASWPVYWAVERARLGCPVGVVVVTVDEVVAAWAGELISDRNPGGGTLQPLVLGPTRIPLVTNSEEAEEAPELVVLSVLAHADDPRIQDMAEAALSGVSKMTRVDGRVYYDVVVAVLREASRKGLLEKKMLEGLLDKYRDELQGYYKEGLVDGEARGEARGKAQGEAQSILAVLGSRSIMVPEEARQRIQSCRDLSQLDQWIARAALVASVDELFSAS